MADNSSRTRNVVIAAIILIIIIVLLLLTRCMPKKAPTVVPPTPAPVTTPKPEPVPAPSAHAPAAPQPAEVLTPATLTAPARVAAGSVFKVEWTGPANVGDYISVAKAYAPPTNNTKYYSEVKQEPTIFLTAPILPGTYELRYITAHSGTILGRIPIEVDATLATLSAPETVVMGDQFNVTWTGPDNKDDFITIVKKGAPDDAYTSYAGTRLGAPRFLTAPIEPGDHEIRYVTGDGRKVLARLAIKVLAAEVRFDAIPEIVAGSTIDIAWAGPNNKGDYITIVKKDTPDGRYDKYANTSAGSPLKLLTPIMVGDAEIRYMSGQGNHVLGRRDLKIIAASITLQAPDTCKPDAPVTITWAGPNHNGDYITIVKKGTPDGQYGKYTNTTKGSPLTVIAPKDLGDAEIRYCSGQGNVVLARIAIKVAP